MDKYIAAYHYTKEIEKGYFAKNGLKPLSAEYIDWVLNETCSVFTVEEQEQIRKNFMDRFKPGRKGLIYFTMARKDSDPNLIKFANYFGGECLFINFDESADQTIANKLSQIGEGVIVKFIVPVSEIISSSWSKTVLENWAKLYNKDYKTSLAEGFIQGYISAENIIRTIYIEEK